MGTPLGLAKLLALLVPAALLAVAYGSQYWGQLFPCEMCWWQRYAHFAALPFAAFALMAGRLPDRGRFLVWLAALAIAASGAIGVYHAGVELHIFPGLTHCSQSATGRSAMDMFNTIMDQPIVRCDEVQWADPVLHISMAGWNAIVSLVSAGLILWLSLRRPRAAA